MFVVLHGLVHLLFFGQSWRLFELQPEMVWPEGSWAFSKLVGNATTRTLDSVLYVLGAIGFVSGGIGIFIRAEWWRAVIVSSAAFSAVIILLFWDGGMQMLTEKGLIGLLINIVILVASLSLRWPSQDARFSTHGGI
jgi:hypothetical protein